MRVQAEEVDVVYPPRPDVFPLRLSKLLFRDKVATVIEAAGCWLLMVIAAAEDDAGCQGPVSFWNDQLAMLMGSVSEPTLVRARQKCVDAGWLNYTKRHRKDGLYFVTIPDGYVLAGKYRRPAAALANESKGQAGRAKQKEARAKAFVNDAVGGGDRGPLALAQTKGIDGQRFCPPSLPSCPPTSGEDPPTPFGGVALVDDATTDEVDSIGSQVRPEPLAVLIAAWVTAKLPGWDAPCGIRENSTRRGLFTQRQRNPHWRKNWQVAVERLGKSRRARGGQQGFEQGIRLDTFLKDEGFLDRILEGDWDDHGHGAATVPTSPSGRNPMLDIGKLDGWKTPAARGDSDVG